MQLDLRSRARPVVALLLAGRIRPSPILDAFGIHELCLPIGPEGRLLDAWLRKLSEIPQLQQARVIVNTTAEVSSINAAIGMDHGHDFGFELSITADRAAWRGAGGVVGDAIESLELADDTLVLVCEAKRLPPNLRPLATAVGNEVAPCGAVGVCGNGEPAGIYLFEASLAKVIPSVGYFDLKEQFLPALSRRRHRVVSVPLSAKGHRVVDAESYLAAVKHSLQDGMAESVHRLSPRASVSSSAVVNGHCIVEAGAVVEDGAVIHDSVVLWGATIGGGAVVSRSVIGPLATVAPRSRVAKQTIFSAVPGPIPGDALSEFASQTRSRIRQSNRLDGEVVKW